jgi:hypothetical protein
MGDVIEAHRYWQIARKPIFQPVLGWPYFGIEDIPKVMFLVGTYDEALHAQSRHKPPRLIAVKE